MRMHSARDIAAAKDALREARIVAAQSHKDARDGDTAIGFATLLDSITSAEDRLDRVVARDVNAGA